MPNCCCRSVIRLRTCAWMETSSAETGSSATTSRGRVISARAMAMRWRWPPENSCGYLRPSSALQAHRLQRLGDARRRLAARNPIEAGERLADDARDRLARIERAIGVLEDHLHMRAHFAQRRRAAARFIAEPISRACPEVGRSSAIAARASVDLPEPDSPTMPKERPAVTLKLTPSTARNCGLGANRRSRGKRKIFDEIDDLQQRRVALRFAHGGRSAASILMQRAIWSPPERHRGREAPRRRRRWSAGIVPRTGHPFGMAPAEGAAPAIACSRSPRRAPTRGRARSKALV